MTIGCIATVMDQVDTPAEFFAIDRAVDTLRCDAVEDLTVTTTPDPPDNGSAWTTTVPRVERRSTGAMLCQYASAGRSASDCAVRPPTTDYQRVCCCGRSAVTDCPLLTATAPTTAPTEDDDGDDGDKQKGVIKKIIGKFIDVIIGIVLAIFGHIDGSVEFWFGRQ
jgi:hypothetical protein